MAAPPLASDVQYGTSEYGFNKLPSLQEMQTNFWASVVGMPATSKIVAAEQLTSSELSEESFAEGGEYLPLGVWANRGFDVTRIEQHTRDDDKRICPVLGICFRLRIISKTNVHKRGMLRESKRQRTAPEDQAASASAAAAGFAAAPLALEDGRASSSSDSSDSSSSDSSDSRRRKKSKKAWKQAKKSKKDDKKDKKSKKSNKEKKNKKSKKDKDDKTTSKEMSAAEKKALEREGKIDIKAADVLISKLSPAVACLNSLVDKPNFMHIAPAIKDPLIALQIKFKELMSHAEAVQASGHGKVDADIKTVACDLALYRKQYQLATTMLALMERGSRTTGG